MVRIEMLAVGRELLIGRTVNTNAHWIGKRLALMGSMLARVATVDDDLEEISSATREALSRRPDYLLVAGGLGPTPDDMTLNGVAKGVNRGIGLNRLALKQIRDHYTKAGRGDFKITPARRKMAMLPDRATPMPNRIGTAPGVRIQEGTTVIFCLPGVPAEMKSIFARSAEPEIRSRVGRLFRKAARLKLERIYESALAPMIARELKRHPGAYIKSHPKGVKRGLSRIELDVVVVSEEEELAQKSVVEIVSEFRAGILSAGGEIKSMKGVEIGGTG